MTEKMELMLHVRSVNMTTKVLKDKGRGGRRGLRYYDVW